LINYGQNEDKHINIMADPTEKEKKNTTEDGR